MQQLVRKEKKRGPGPVERNGPRLNCPLKKTGKKKEEAILGPEDTCPPISIKRRDEPERTYMVVPRKGKENGGGHEEISADGIAL